MVVRFRETFEGGFLDDVAKVLDTLEGLASMLFHRNAHKRGIPRTWGPAAPQSGFVSTQATAVRNRGIGDGASSRVSGFPTDYILALGMLKAAGTGGSRTR